MKHLLLLLSFVFAAGFATAQEAQTVKKTCTKAEKAACAKKCTAAEKAACAKKGITCAKKGSTAATADADTDAIVESDASESNVLSAIAEADLAADEDESIVRKECPMSGKVSYYQESVCAKSGKVSMSEVKYCTDSNAFVNASPSDMAKGAEAKVIKTANTADGKVQSAKAKRNVPARKQVLNNNNSR